MLPRRQPAPSTVPTFYTPSPCGTPAPSTQPTQPPLPACTHKLNCLQLERKGYFIVDVPFSSADKPIVLLNIPDGRARVFPGMPAP